jgi:hypothetical protein
MKRQSTLNIKFLTTTDSFTEPLTIFQPPTTPILATMGRGGYDTTGAGTTSSDDEEDKRQPVQAPVVDQGRGGYDTTGAGTTSSDDDEEK